MAKPATILSVFLASPDDVSEERESLEPVIQELNNTLGSFFGVRLELISSDTHSYPGAGSDPQAVINAELPNDYDIFVGILSTRFGTPTGRAGSGTEEEFQRAYTRYKEHSDQVGIMVYFNKTSPDKLEKINPEQLRRVNSFREQLSGKGIYFGEYSGADDFRTRIRLHLTLQILAWIRSQSSAKPMVTTEPKAGSKSQDQNVITPKTEETVGRSLKREEITSGDFLSLYRSSIDTDLGYLELQEIATENFRSLYESALRMTASTEQLGKDLAAAAKRVSDATTTGATDLKSRIETVNLAADPYETFVMRAKPEVALFSVKFKQAIDAYTKGMLLWPQSLLRDPASPNPAMDSLIKSRDGFKSLIVSVETARASVAATPPLTARLIRAIQQTLSLLDDYTSQIQNAISIVSDAMSICQGLIDKLQEEKASKSS